MSSPRYLLLFESHDLVFVGRPLTRGRVRVRVRVRVNLRLAVYRQSVRLGAEPFETYGQNFFFSTEHLWSQSLYDILSDERMGLSFTIAAGPHQRIHSRVRFPWGSRTYFTVSNSRLPILSPPTTRRATLEVLDPASTRVCRRTSLYSRGTDHIETPSIRDACLQLRCLALRMARTIQKTPLLLSEFLCNLATSCSMVHKEHSLYCCVRWNVHTESLPSNGYMRHNRHNRIDDFRSKWTDHTGDTAHKVMYGL
jgi:hypothetical protein